MRWDEILADNVTTLDELSASIPQINEYGDIASKVLNKYPMSIPRYYLSLVNPDAVSYTHLDVYKRQGIF